VSFFLCDFHERDFENMVIIKLYNFCRNVVA
jgi:hypothetical protein